MGKKLKFRGLDGLPVEIDGDTITGIYDEGRSRAIETGRDKNGQVYVKVADSLAEIEKQLGK